MIEAAAPLTGTDAFALCIMHYIWHLKMRYAPSRMPAVDGARALYRTIHILSPTFKAQRFQAYLSSCPRTCRCMRKTVRRVLRSSSKHFDDDERIEAAEDIKFVEEATNALIHLRCLTETQRGAQSSLHMALRSPEAPVVDEDT